MTIFKFSAALAAAFALVLTGCADDGPTGVTAGDTTTGTLAVGITAEALDAPLARTIDTTDDDVAGAAPELTSLVLTFDALRLYPGPGGSFGGFVRNGADDQGTWVELALPEPISVDLLALEADLVDLIAASEIPSGTYRGVGVHLLDARATTVDGAEIPVVLPSDHFEFLRVMSHFSVDAGAVEGLALTLDLDAMINDCALREGELVLRPVIGNVGIGEDPHAWKGWGGEAGPHGQGGPPEGAGDGECDGDGEGPGEGSGGSGPGTGPGGGGSNGPGDGPGDGECDDA